jgi:glycosyltransferase involved in cell wall biosynthesis
MNVLSAENTVIYDPDVINILTVGRLSEEKGHMRVVDALFKLKEDGYKFCWHIVGNGPEAEKLAEIAEEYNMSRNIVLHGDTENPYRYYVNADVLLVPSYHEAAPMVFGEAEYFRLPVLATKTTSTQELVIDKNIGIVTENSDEGILKGLEYVFKNPQILRHIKYYDREIPDNSEALTEFYQLIEGE